jgi:cyclic beta-1,2-glucan synthetase
MTPSSLTDFAEKLASSGECVPSALGHGHHYSLGDLIAECDKTLRAYVDKPGSGPASAWILDNYADLHAALRDIKNAIPRRYYALLPRLSAGTHKGTPRIERNAIDLADFTSGELDAEMLAAFFTAYQQTRHLTLAELWASIHLVRFALIDRVAREINREEPRESAIRGAITSLRGLESLTWKNVVESISYVERILREDPSGDYARMDFETRDMYRHSVEQCARASHKKKEDAALAEERTAEAACACARRTTPGSREHHVGYWLIDKGREKWRAECGYHHKGVGFRRFILCHPTFSYLTPAALVTLAIVACSAWILQPSSVWWLALLIFPALHVALAIVNPLVTFTLPPRLLPRYDFSDGIPPEYKTFVVVPTLLLSRENVESLLENVEIHYLANRDPNILFALLTDFPDAPTPEGPHDDLIHACAEGIEKLNHRYATPGYQPFYLFHRPRIWNESENRWMGRERKRGKLNDFNRFLLGRDDAFSVRVGRLEAAHDIKYVLTLDSDTQLPRDTARKLIATLAHPLNRAVIDPVKKVVREGYGLLQPRVGVSVQSSVKSRLARIYSGQVGFDPYATAVSDVYQDLYGRASFTGKGIYDLATFELTAGERFPDNTLLSHDLIEGEHVRVGLVTDQEVIDDFPARYEAFSKRKHRWVRGDWQILRWLFSRVPAPENRTQPNPLRLSSRWKIFDNLRRSLMEPSLLILFLAAWTGLPGSPLAWTLVALALFVLPVWFDLIVAAIRIPPTRYLILYAREVSWRFVRGHGDALLTLIFLPHQALLMTDAVLRTLVRQFWTHRNLLQWESMAAVESGAASGTSLAHIYLLCSPVLALAVMFFIPGNERWSNLAFILLELWLVAPLVAMWLDAKPAGERGLTVSDVAFLRDTALRTWRYFVDFTVEESQGLVPDNVQETPPTEAHRTSPTNIGLQLNAYAAALDFGYVTTEEFGALTSRTFMVLENLTRYRGHFLNWYDTRELVPLEPRYISSVDSGNLAASLLTMKQGCLEAAHRNIVTLEDLRGLHDHCERLRNALSEEERTPSVLRALNSLCRQLSSEPTDLFFWEGLLSESLVSSRRIVQMLSSVKDPDACYWRDRFAARIQALLDQLYRFAPWLWDPCEREFRFCFNRPAFEPLMKLLREPLNWNDLLVRYDQIEAETGKILADGPAMHDLTREALEILRTRLGGARERTSELLRSLRSSAAIAERWVREMDFGFLFDDERKLLRIGCSAEGIPDDSYYDLLASEARTAVLLGIAKGELPREAWFHLGRKLTQWRGHNCLVSWSGTMFEYLMPNLFMRTWEGTLLHESCRSVVKIQKQHARELHIPWGVSESAWNSRDSMLNYQYHAFGVPMLAARRDFTDRVVITPYATMLALTADPLSAVENARVLADRGWLGRYGFYEAIDFTPSGRFGRSGEGDVVRAWMAHHQGMSLVAIGAAVMNAPMQKRFHADPLVQAAEYLLQERVPNLIGNEIEESKEMPRSAHGPEEPTEESTADQLQKA